MKWISVKDELPKVGQEVIIYEKYSDRSKPRIKISSRTETHWNSPFFCIIEHWMPLPEKP